MYVEIARGIGVGFLSSILISVPMGSGQAQEYNRGEESLERRDTILILTNRAQVNIEGSLITPYNLLFFPVIICDHSGLPSERMKSSLLNSPEGSR